MRPHEGRFRHAPKTLTEEEQNKLLEITAECTSKYRDHVLLSVALGTALRQHEIRALNVGDVWDEKRKRVKERLVLTVYKGCRRKAPRCQEVLLPDVLREKLEAFLDWKKNRGESLRQKAPLFLTLHTQRRLGLRQMRRLFLEWQEKAEMARPLRFHALRHTACTNLYRMTRDIRLTQQFARHSSIETTMVYTHPSEEDLKYSVNQLPC